MFTGIVREVGEVEALERSGAGARLRIHASLASELAPGDSVSVSGVCLTVAERNEDGFAADVMNQTLSVTTLGDCVVGDRVNLEPALKAGEPLGGHLVQGHIDCRGDVERMADDGFARRLEIAIPDDFRRYLVERGSIAIDGVSLTVASLTRDGFEVSLIPETLERTTLGGSTPDSPWVNVEVDQIARYAERLLSSFGKEGNG